MNLKNGDMNLTLIVNPAAGRGKGEKAHPGIARHMERLGLNFRTLFSEGPGHIEELARDSAAKGSDAVVACGGDGTFHEVINGLDGHGIPVGIIPCGTGDDLAFNLGIPFDYFEACRTLAEGTVRRVDLARAGERVYACIAGAGFDSMVNRAANEGARFLKGTSVYVYSMLKTLISFKPLEMSIEADDFHYTGRVMFVVAANSMSYGGRMKIAPMAAMDDGYLDLIIVEEISKFELLRVFPRVFSGKHVDHPCIRHHRTKSLKLSSPRSLELFSDGEYVQDLPVKIEVLPKALPIIVPRK